MSTIHIDASRCCGDALCVRVCPARCLRMRGDKAAPVPLSENLCLGCGQCVAICPKAAVTLNGADPVVLPAAKPAVAPDDFALLAKSRRSVRAFKEQPVPHDVLLRALDTARYAPTGKNRQDVEWIALEGQDALPAFVSLIIDAMRGMPGTERLVAAFEKGRDPILNGAPCAVFAHASNTYDFSAADCALAVGYLELMLHSMGLGTCWAGYALRVAQLDPKVQQFLGLPEGRQVYGGIMVGYPALRYSRIPERKAVRLTWR